MPPAIQPEAVKSHVPHVLILALHLLGIKPLQPWSPEATGVPAQVFNIRQETTRELLDLGGMEGQQVCITGLMAGRRRCGGGRAGKYQVWKMCVEPAEERGGKGIKTRSARVQGWEVEWRIKKTRRRFYGREVEDSRW
jgi:hypothetical protein